MKPEKTLRLSLFASLLVTVASCVYVFVGPAKVNLWLILGSAIIVVVIGLAGKAISLSSSRD